MHAQDVRPGRGNAGQLFVSENVECAAKMDRLCPRNAGQSTRHMCEKDTWAVGPTWNVHLSPISEDKGQYSTTRGGQGEEISSGFESAKALVRGLPLAQLPSFQGQLGSYKSYDLGSRHMQDPACGLAVRSKAWPQIDWLQRERARVHQGERATLASASERKRA